MMMVKASSVGATPEACTSRCSKWLMKLDLPLLWLPSSNTIGYCVLCTVLESSGPW